MIQLMSQFYPGCTIGTYEYTWVQCIFILSFLDSMEDLCCKELSNKVIRKYKIVSGNLPLTHNPEEIIHCQARLKGAPGYRHLIFYLSPGKKQISCIPILRIDTGSP